MAPPIYVKGGVWTNVEDQILKAAVSKYGLTQWSRVASLLPKKTAKQAKARWNEYLNPSIDRSTWSREQDEKLLSLAKLLPNQWRSIALIMGRTATLCLERYQKLLDAAAAKTSRNTDEDEDEETAGLRLTALGIESLPALGNAFESLPSRPDAEDMDDDEREMLSEAKARLANTQGKKAMRKDRERMLEESRRVALLQKRRELKAAGINVSLTLKNKARRKEFDYNADIPHERQPKAGLYDIKDEEGHNEALRARFQKEVRFKGIAASEPKDKDIKKEKAAVERDATRIKASTRLAAEAVSGIDAAQQAKRRKLELPAPGTRIEEEAIQERILARSRELLLAQNTGNSHAHAIPSAATPQHTGTEPVVRVSKKLIVGMLRALLARVPEPREKTRVVFPSLEDPGKTLEVEGAIASEAHLELLRQVDEEKARARRSQVIQRGLGIPNLESLDIAADGQWTDDMKREFEALVRYDLDQSNPVPAYIDEDMIERVEKLVAKEAEAHIANKSHVSEPAPLPQLEQAITETFELLHALDASAREADQRLAILEDTGTNAKTLASLEQKIAENAREILEADLDERVLQRIMWNEEAAIEMRSATLTELVEAVKAAEGRVRRLGVV